MVESVEDALVPGLCVLYFVFKKVPSYIFFVFCNFKEDLPLTWSWPLRIFWSLLRETRPPHPSEDPSVFSNKVGHHCACVRSLSWLSTYWMKVTSDLRVKHRNKLSLSHTFGWTVFTSGMSITEVFNMPLLCGPKYVGWAFQREFNKDTQVPFYWGDNVKIIFADVQDSGQMEKCLDWSHNIGDHLLIKERSTCCKPSQEPRTRYIQVLFGLEAKYRGSGCITCWQRTGQRLTNIKD